MRYIITKITLGKWVDGLRTIRRTGERIGWPLVGLAAMCAVIWLVSLMLGQYFVSFQNVWKIVFARVTELLPDAWESAVKNFFGLNATWEKAAETVVLQVRLPRATAAALIGAALAASGAAYQGVFRNPLVSPDVLGASSGAAFGAALGIFCAFGYFGISLAAFVCGLGAVVLASFISKISRRNNTLTMVLTGMMISALFSSGTSLIKLVADTDEVLPAITYWLMGSLAAIRGADVRLIFLPIVVGMVPLLLLRWKLNLLTLEEEEARSLGVATGPIRAVVIVCATLLTATSVAVSGLIGWVGLVIPHFARMLFGGDYRRVLPASCLLGAAFLMIVDNAARLLAVQEIPLGILTSFVGAPVFLLLILKGGRRDGN